MDRESLRHIRPLKASLLALLIFTISFYAYAETQVFFGSVKYEAVAEVVFEV